MATSSEARKRKATEDVGETTYEDSVPSISKKQKTDDNDILLNLLRQMKEQNEQLMEQMKEQMKEQNEQLMEQLREQMKEQNEQMKEQNEQMNEKLRKVSFDLEHISRDVKELTTQSLFKDMNPWLEMSETDRSRAKNLRSNVFKKLGLTDFTAACWLTGTEHKATPVKVAHILPDSTKKKVSEALRLDSGFRNDVEAPKWNFMLLREDIEEAFDSLKVSFVPKDIFNPNTFVLKVWDKSAVTEEISNLDGRTLNVPPGISLCRRVLSYQSLCAYVTAKKGNSDLDIAEPADFSSEFENRQSVFEQLRSILTTSIREERREEDDEQDEYCDEENVSSLL